VGLFFWRWVTVRLGAPRAARLSVLYVGVMPVLVGLLPNLNVILAVSAVNGFFTAGLIVSHINVLLDAIPPGRQPQFMGLWAATLNAGAFICPLLSVWLAARWGIVTALLFCGVVGMFGAASHWIWRVPGRQPKPAALVGPEIEGA
jgi:MFS family permease